MRTSPDMPPGSEHPQESIDAGTPAFGKPTVVIDQRKPKVWQPPTPQDLTKVLPQYEVDMVLGRGGMGAVYKGIHKTLDRVVAIKILPPEMDDLDTSFAERFKNEARAMARLTHPNIVSVYDFGETKTGLLYFVMEYVEGVDVQRMLREQGHLQSEHVKNIIDQVCDALDYAHEKNIIHRDIKPANIMVGYDGKVKVADFGLAKINQGTEVGLTGNNMLLGTLHYMAPESLMLGNTVDHRADIYALGVMLYQMLTGKLPQGMFEMPSKKVPGLDPKFDVIVANALRENRDQRYQTVAQMRNDFEEIMTPLTSHKQTRRSRSSNRLGRYKIVTDEMGKPVLLGAGSAGKTYKASHSLLGTTVALKIIHEALAYDAEVRQRFLNEAKAIAKLKHPHIAQLVDCDDDDGALFCAIEYCDGGDLEKLVSSRGALPEESVLLFGRQAAKALSYVHHEGFLHRDLKPSNLMLSMVPGTNTANIKLIDFGLVKALGQTSGLTRKGQFRGTLLYTSPEQLRDEELDERTDIFSLGMTLWFLLIGKPPMDNNSSEITQRRLSGKSHAEMLPKSVHPAIRTLLTQMLHPEIKRRARNMDVVLAGMDECLNMMRRTTGKTTRRRALPDSIRESAVETSNFENASAMQFSSAPRQTTANPPQQPPGQPPPDGPEDSSSPEYPPENVQFTVFRPRSITRDVWRKMLVYAHLDDGPIGQSSSFEKVKDEVAHLLRYESQEYTSVTKDSRGLVPREAEIQFVPRAAGVRFNPPVRSFFWSEGLDMHREEFEVRASADTLTAELVGTLTVYLGILIIAELPLRFQIMAQKLDEPPIGAKPYRQIFPSYSRRDDLIVQQLESYASTLGDSYLKDVTTLRAGEEWSPRLLQLIEAADVFQLFWSSRSASSKEVEREWRHALLQRKAKFIRPTFWEQPMPEAPPEMKHLHFAQLHMPATERNISKVRAIPQDGGLNEDDVLQTIVHRPRQTPPEPENASQTRQSQTTRGSVPTLQKFDTTLRTKFELLEEQQGVHSSVGKSFRARRLSTSEIVQVTLMHAEIANDKRAIKELRNLHRKTAECPGEFLMRPLTMIRFLDHAVLVEEFVEGPRVLSVLRARQRLSLLEAIPVFRQVAEACDIASAAGIQSLDLAPHHVVLQLQGQGDGTSGNSEMKSLLSQTLAQWPPFVVRLGLRYPGAEDEGDLPWSYAKLVYHLLSGMQPRATAFRARHNYAAIAGLSEDANRLMARILAREFQADGCIQLLRSLLQLESIPVEFP